MTVDELLIQYGAISTDLQLSLGDQIGTWNWSVDMSAGEIQFQKPGLFGKKRRSPIQVLGSASEISNTWLWSWANDSIPSQLTEVAKELCNRQKSELGELCESSLDLTDVSAHEIALIVGGMRKQPYYRGPYPNGAMFLLLSDPSFISPPAPIGARVATVFPQFIAAIPVSDHMRALRPYLSWCGFEITGETSTRLEARTQGAAVVASFDDQRRMVNLELKSH